MYLYSIAPIDYFAAFMPVELYIARAVSIEGATPAGVALIQRHVDRCLSLLSEYRHYRPDDRVAGPFVSAVPFGDGTADPGLIVSVKVSNNGEFYVASPLRLPWLDDYEPDVVEAPSRPELIWDAADEWTT